ncbi:MAG: chemotaxis protein CheC [Candidatus Hydrothermarchaeales archaeon]
MEPHELTDAQVDTLKEVGNIGAGHATTALAQMLGKKVFISVPTVSMVEIKDIPEFLGGAETQVVGIHFKILGEAKGSMVLSFNTEQALFLADTLLRAENESTEIDPDRESALKELGNILASAYLTALSTFLGSTLIPSVPAMTHDTAENLVDTVLDEVSKTMKHAVILETEFTLPPQILGGQFLVFFEPDSFEFILKALGMQ